MNAAENMVIPAGAAVATDPATPATDAAIDTAASTVANSVATTAGLLAGRITVSAQWRGTADGGRLAAIACRVERPDLARLFAGLPPLAVAARLPRLYALCGEAQGAAARLALGLAGPEDLDPAPVVREMLREHAWRLFLDWPARAGAAPDRAGFAALVRASATEPACLPAALAARLGCSVGELPALAWRAAEEGASWGTRAASPDSFAGHQLAWAASVDRAWGGGSALVTPATPATPVADALAGRWRALLRAALALAEADEMARADSAFPAEASTLVWEAGFACPAPGVGQVSTARGVLRHTARLGSRDNGEERVAGYRIDAPTEALFAPAGPFAATLAQARCASPAQARELAETLALAFDPCVPLVWRIGAAPEAADDGDWSDCTAGTGSDPSPAVENFHA
ncbi:hypothetical protein [Oryzomicrobium sp.]|uniref:hypothetical protein n=1 Tax=Oryzomicrobium sp. TaxID=1911578 RepID=UPI002FDFF708